jgi:low affinity Fe/Cu permease
MGDSGEGLIDAEARIQERMDERAAEREQRQNQVQIDPARHQEIESLRLALSQLQQQAEAASHPVRKEQLSLAMKDIEKRLEDLGYWQKS